MRTLFRLVFLALVPLTCGAASAEITWRFTKGEDVLALAAAADRLEIVAAPPQLAEPTILAAKQFKQLLPLFNFSAEPLRGVKLVINGMETWERSPCQCLGDYLLRFRKGTGTLVEFTVHHKQFIRLRVDGHDEEFDLVPASGEALQAFLDRLNVARGGVRESKLIPLTSIDSWPADQLDARRALVAAVENAKLQPREYFAERGAALRDGKHEYHLWHETALKNTETGVMGDPTGRCRTAVYDPSSRSVERMYRWR